MKAAHSLGTYTLAHWYCCQVKYTVWCAGRGMLRPFPACPGHLMMPALPVWVLAGPATNGTCQGASRLLRRSLLTSKRTTAGWSSAATTALQGWLCAALMASSSTYRYLCCIVWKGLQTLWCHRCALAGLLSMGSQKHIPSPIGKINERQICCYQAH